MRHPGQPGVFVLYERYTDEVAFQAHLATEHWPRLRGQVLPFLEERNRLDLVPLGD